MATPLGFRSIAIGRSSSATASANGAVALGAFTTASHVQSAVISPNNASVANQSTSANEILLGRPGVTPRGFAAFATISDARDKRDSTELKFNALEYVNAMTPKQYRMDFRSDYARYEEINEARFEKLETYTQRHFVINERVYSIKGSDIEWIESEMLRPQEAAQGSRVRGVSGDRYATHYISDFVKDKEAAIKQFKFLSADRKQEIIPKELYIKYAADGETGKELSEEEVEELVVEDLIVQHRTAKFLRVELEPDGSRAGKRFHWGFEAQQLEEAAQSMGIDCPAVEYLAHNKDEGGVPAGHDLYSVKYTELIAPMVGAIQELAATVEGLKCELAELKQKLAVKGEAKT